MLRRLIVPVIVLTLVTAAAMAQECPHAAKPAGCAGEDPSLGKDRCIWSWEGVQWTLLEKPDAVVAQAVVPGCSKRSAAIRSSMAAQIPTCKGEACGCSCPFSTEGLTFEVRNEERSLFVTATGPAAALASFKAAMEKKIAGAPATPGGCGGSCGGSCGGHGAPEVFQPEKAGGCGCGGK